MSHTPGPWTTIKYPDVKSHTVYGGADRSRSLATVKGPNAGDDARLIAAAPELLEACENAISWLSQIALPIQTEKGSQGDKLLSQLEHAVTKAIHG